MSVGNVGGTDFNPQAMAAKMASSIMKEADADGSGTLSKAEMKALQANKGGRGPNVDQVYSTYNKSGDGELTQDELQLSIEGMAKSGRPSGPPPSGAPANNPTNTSSASASTLSTDPMDEDGDGNVSEAEEKKYELTHPEKAQSESKADNAADKSQKQMTSVLNMVG